MEPSWQLNGKESTCNAGDAGSIPGSERSPGGGYGNPLQHSCLENPMDRGACWPIAHRVTKSQPWLEVTEHIDRSVILYNDSGFNLVTIFSHLFLFHQPKIYWKSMPWQYYLKNACFSLTCSVIMTRVLSCFFFGTGFPSVSIPFVSYNTDNHLFILMKIWIISLRTGWPVCRKHITEDKYSSMNQAILRCRLFRLCESHHPCNTLPLPFHLFFYNQSVAWVAYSCDVSFFYSWLFQFVTAESVVTMASVLCQKNNPYIHFWKFRKLISGSVFDA